MPGKKIKKGKKAAGGKSASVIASSQRWGTNILLTGKLYVSLQDGSLLCLGQRIDAGVK